MDMKKVTCTILIIAASMSVVVAANEVLAPAPSLSNGAFATLPFVGSLLGASISSLFALFH
uniref:Arabinogalactan peptide 23 n=1 Tax=Cajanus cajan TaxID=3821 RepID=A0A151U291_CAJCA|nr:hypothetical protein KK1_006077 [Cajanus cajan]